MQQERKWSEHYLAKYPDSYKHSSPPHNTYVRFEYTAKNGFGGSVRDDVICMHLGKSLVQFNERDLMEANDDLSLSVPR